jgi:hypothetical protein
MSTTYSINVGTIIESSKKSDIYSALVDLPDNVQKKISPRDLRDAIFTSWASAAFKLTTPDSINVEYIGIDSSNPEDRDIKKKILLGKRTVGNLDVISNTLLTNSDADIFIYNTKADSLSQNETKVAILAGTDSQLYYTAPWIGATFSPSTNTIGLEIRNPQLTGGPINIYSDSGRVGINGVAFPTVAETLATASSGKILKYYGTYPNGFLQWSDPTITTNVIGQTGSPTYIFGSSSYVNGYPLEFIVSGQVVPQNIGGIQQGDSFDYFTYFSSISSTFQNWPIVEVLRKLLYPYIEPQLSISVTNPSLGTTYAEVGTTPSTVINFSITTFARGANEYIRDYYIQNSATWSTATPGPGGLSFSAIPGTQLSLTASGTTYSNVVGSLDYVLNVSNTWQAPFGYSYSATASINFVSPIVAVFAPTSQFDLSVIGTTPQEVLNRSKCATIIIDASTVSSSKKIIAQPGVSQSVSIDVDGTGYLYFAYPQSYGNIQYIKDPNGFIIHDIYNLTYSSFTYSNPITLQPPFTYYGNYTLYRTNLTCSYMGIGEFELVF